MENFSWAPGFIEIWKWDVIMDHNNYTDETTLRKNAVLYSAQTPITCIPYIGLVYNHLMLGICAWHISSCDFIVVSVCIGQFYITQAGGEEIPCTIPY